MAKKYILSVTRNVLTQENRQNCLIILCIKRCNQHSFYRCTLNLQSFDFFFIFLSLSGQQQQKKMTECDHGWFLLRCSFVRSFWYCWVNAETSTFLRGAAGGSRQGSPSPLPTQPRPPLSVVTAGPAEPNRQSSACHCYSCLKMQRTSDPQLLL